MPWVWLSSSAGQLIKWFGMFLFRLFRVLQFFCTSAWLLTSMQPDLPYDFKRQHCLTYCMTSNINTDVILFPASIKFVQLCVYRCPIPSLLIPLYSSSIPQSFQTCPASLSLVLFVWQWENPLRPPPLPVPTPITPIMFLLSKQLLVCFFSWCTHCSFFRLFQ